MEGPAANDGFLAFGEDQAAELSGIQLRTIREWTTKGLIRPAVQRRVGQRSVRLFYFDDMLALLVAAELRAHFPLQQIRKVVDHLRDHEGVAEPLVEVRFSTDRSKNIMFERSDATVSDDSRTNQIVLSQILHLEPLRARLRAGGSRDANEVGTFERKRGRLGSKETIAGTRIPVAQVDEYLDAGRSPAQILESFPSLTMADVEAVMERRGSNPALISA